MHTKVFKNGSINYNSDLSGETIIQNRRTGERVTMDKEELSGLLEAIMMIAFDLSEPG